MSRFRPQNEYEALVYVIELLARRYPTVGDDVIVRIVAEELERTSGAAVRGFIPELVERNTRRRLRDTRVSGPQDLASSANTPDARSLPPAPSTRT